MTYATVPPGQAAEMKQFKLTAHLLNPSAPFTFGHSRDRTRNLAIANRSHVSNAHVVTTANFQGGGRVIQWEEKYGKLVVTATAGGINFSVG